ncbi:MAG: GMC family oxidoreductase [Pseudomonadota bacterium]
MHEPEKSFHADAIVVGAGAAGGLAAQLLTEAGLNVTVLDAGWTRPFHKRPMHWALSKLSSKAADPRALSFLPSGFVWKGRQVLKLLGSVRQPVQSNCFAWERAPDSFVDDLQNPFCTPEESPFTWLRARQVGGRMTVPGHGRQYYRLSPEELQPADGQSAQWPVTADELAPWYARVEEMIGLNGRCEGHPAVPDSKIKTELTHTRQEQVLCRTLTDHWPELKPVLGRYAPPINTIDAARRTGRMTLQRGAIAKRVIVNSAHQAEGVEWIDARSKEVHITKAPIVFLCASAFESTRILMMSSSAQSAEGLGARSGALGSYIMDHVLVRSDGTGGALEDEPVSMEDGRCIYLPRFDQVFGETGDLTRGFGLQLYQSSGRPGSSYFTAVSFGEMIPDEKNRIELDPRRCDAWGIPIPHIICTHTEHERQLAGLQAEALKSIADLMGAKLTQSDLTAEPPGMAAHECGGARFGRSPENSVLDSFCESWDARGLFVTDGSVFPSQGTQNPTLTIMALTARACERALVRYGAALQPFEESEKLRSSTAASGIADG